MKFLFCLSIFFSFHASADLLTATYVVPASPDGSVPSATYPVNNVSFGRDPYQRQILSFNLPEDLVGTDFPVVSMTEDVLPNPAVLSFSSSRVSALCSPGAAKGTTLCQLKYVSPYFSIDAQKVTQLLNQKYLSDPQALKNKLQISGRFTSDPEGVLILSMP